jgi:hypothetical protein
MGEEVNDNGNSATGDDNNDYRDATRKDLNDRDR